jgi:hypothetical protein
MINSVNRVNEHFLRPIYDDVRIYAHLTVTQSLRYLYTTEETHQSVPFNKKVLICSDNMIFSTTDGFWHLWSIAGIKDYSFFFIEYVYYKKFWYVDVRLVSVLFVPNYGQTHFLCFLYYRNRKLYYSRATTFCAWMATLRFLRGKELWRFWALPFVFPIRALPFVCVVLCHGINYIYLLIVGLHT